MVGAQGCVIMYVHTHVRIKITIIVNARAGSINSNGLFVNIRGQLSSHGQQISSSTRLDWDYRMS